MFDNMTGTVGFAMHEDRLAQAAKNMRLMEAEQGKQTRAGAAHHGHREALAKRCIALAVRIAPTVAQPSGHLWVMD